jgi:hypothetical protein
MIQIFLSSLRRKLAAFSGDSDDKMTLRHHRNNDGSHTVEISTLRVLLFRDGAHWIAQGLDLDYAASGETISDVKRRFSDGLCLTINEHLEKHENLDFLIRPAPPEVWRHFYRIEESLETSLQEEANNSPIAALRRLAFLQEAKV